MNLRSEMPKYDTPALAAEWHRARRIFENIGELEVPAAMMMGTRRILFQTVLAMGADTVLDIGTHTGLSALTFALAGCDVVSLDKIDANGPTGRWVKHKRRRPVDTLKAAGVAERVSFVTRSSLDYLAHTADRYDFICIDGNHKGDYVYHELPLALRCLNKNGLIFMDDMQPPGYEPLPGWAKIAGPWSAVDRHIRAGMAIKVVPISTTLEGERTATAFLLSC